MCQMQHTKNSSATLVISYLNLRKTVGFLGISFPFILAFGAFEDGIQKSISHYYYTNMGDVFVGILFVFGMMLYSYKGYEKKDGIFKDDIFGDLACFFALGVALFPTTPADILPDIIGAIHPADSQPGIIGVIHFVSAASFFLILAYFSFFLFTKSDPKKGLTLMKKRRNLVYRACGIAIAGSIVLIVVWKLLPHDIQVHFRAINNPVFKNPVFYLESIAVVAFGISWLTKGEAMMRD